MRDVVAKGELDAQREASTNGPFFTQITTRLGEILECPPNELRMPLHSSITLVGRYAVSSDDEMLSLTAKDNIDDALASAEEHLRHSVRLLMRLPPN